MLTALLPLPADRTEPAPRRDATDAPPGSRFADLLQQRRAAAATPADPKAPPRQAPQSAGGAATHGAKTTPTQPGRSASARDTGSDDDRQGVEAIDLDATPAAEVTGGEAAKKPAAADDAHADQAPPAPPLGVDPTTRTPAADSTPADATAVDSAATARTLRPASTTGGSARRGSADAEAGSPGAAASTAATTTDLQIALPAPAQDAARPAPAAREAAPPLPAGATMATPRFADAIGAPPPTVALPAALHAPEFAQVLGAHVSVFARDGVQQAELRINPPEMGPIGVQIEIDGRDARVNFHAGAAATREVIERALPELAAALRSEGLTLAGGGVFDGSADARQQPRTESGRRAVSGSGAGARDQAPQGRTQLLRTPLGMLDLYA